MSPSGNFVSDTEFYREMDTVNSRILQIQKTQKQLKNKIDSILLQIDTLKDNQKIIIYRLDTLQAGQVVIYSEIKHLSNEQAKTNFFQRLLNFFN